MKSLIIANVIAPTFLVQDTTTGLWLIVGIILVESLVVYWFCRQFTDLQINVIPIFFLVLAANFVSGFFGRLLRIYTAFNRHNLANNIVVIFVACLVSILIEYWVYREYKILKQNKRIRWQSAVLANLASYFLLGIYVVIISFWFPQTTKYKIPPFEARRSIQDIFTAQKIFYFRNNEFASSFDLLPPLDLIIDKQNQTQAKGFHYRYTLSKNRTTAQVTAIPRENKWPISYSALLLSQPNFDYQICEFRDQNPVTFPQVVEGKIQCPPESEAVI
jgi:hypothetical protein